MSEGNDKILKVEQMSKFFGVSKKTIWEWCKAGKLPAFKIGKEWKIRQSDLQHLISQKVKSKKSTDKLF